MTQVVSPAWFLRESVLVKLCGGPLAGVKVKGTSKVVESGSLPTRTGRQQGAPRTIRPGVATIQVLVHDASCGGIY